jgi:hypothetical protein
VADSSSHWWNHGRQSGGLRLLHWHNNDRRVVTQHWRHPSQPGGCLILRPTLNVRHAARPCVVWRATALMTRVDQRCRLACTQLSTLSMSTIASQPPRTAADTVSNHHANSHRRHTPSPGGAGCMQGSGPLASALQGETALCLRGRQSKAPQGRFLTGKQQPPAASAVCTDGMNTRPTTKLAIRRIVPSLHHKDACTAVRCIVHAHRIRMAACASSVLH